MRKSKLRSGFSLVEIAILLLVIGLIVAGAAAASRLIKYVILNTAREATDSTALNYMRRDLIVWFDTTSEPSFLDAETEEGSRISVWYETKPMLTVPASATQSSPDKQPTYAATAINGLPALKFDGVNDLMSITANYTNTSGAPPFYNNFAVFLVAQATGSITLGSEANSGTSGQAGQRFALFPPSGDTTYGSLSGLTSSAGISFGTNGIKFVEHADSYIPPIMVSSLGYSPTVAILMEYRNKMPTLYVNNRLVRTGLASSKTYIFPPFHIGGAPAPWSSFGNFSGYIGEIIIVDRALTAEERNDIFAYLKKKWKLNY